MAWATGQVYGARSCATVTWPCFPFSKTRAVIFNASPTPAPAAQDPRCRVPAASRHTRQTIRRPGSLIYNSVLSYKNASLVCHDNCNRPWPPQSSRQTAQASPMPSDSLRWDLSRNQAGSQGSQMKMSWRWRWRVSHNVGEAPGPPGQAFNSIQEARPASGVSQAESQAQTPHGRLSKAQKPDTNPSQRHSPTPGATSPALVVPAVLSVRLRCARSWVPRLKAFHGG
jgi:hypothetical protein